MWKIIEDTVYRHKNAEIRELREDLRRCLAEISLIKDKSRPVFAENSYLKQDVNNLKKLCNAEVSLRKKNCQRLREMFWRVVGDIPLEVKAKMKCFNADGSIDRLLYSDEE